MSVLSLARIAVLIGALGLLLVGLVLGSLFVLLADGGSGADRVLVNTAGASLVAVTVGSGSALAWHAWRAVRRKRTGSFRPSRTWPLILVWALCVILGQAVTSFDVNLAITLPVLHLAAAGLPAAAVLALTGRALSGQARWRDLVLQTSSGLLISTSLALALELIIGVILALIVLALVSLWPGGQAALESLASSLQDAGAMNDFVPLAPYARSPVVIAFVLLVVAGVVPAIEEGVKAIGVGLLAHRRPSRAEAFLWGVAGGSGFALLEGLFNSLGGMSLWSQTVILRAGATVVHSFTGGLMGLAWHTMLFERRWMRLLALYAMSVALHGLWNAVSVLATVSSLAFADGEGGAWGEAVRALGPIASLLVLAGLAAAITALLLVLAKRLASTPQAREAQGR